MEDLIQIAEASATLLDTQPSPMESGRAELLYRGLARRAGLMRSRGHVDIARLSDGFRERFGAVLPYLDGTDPAVGGGDGWLAAMTRRHRKAVHPLQHILATLYLERLPAAAVTAPTRHPVFGPGPWPCRNPLAAHFRVDVVERFSQYSNRDALVGVFTCSCGYEYTRGVDKTGKLGPPRYRQFGPLLRPVLEASIADGDALRAIARKTGLDPKTVVAEAEALGISVPSKCRRPRREKKACVPKRREPSERRAAKPRTDWQLRDREEAVRVRHAAKVIARELPPVRVTAAEIERRLGRRDWLRHRLHVLPLANAELDRVAEPLEAFQRRRLRWAIDELLADGNGVPAWRVLKLAGLRSDWHDDATNLLASYQNKASSNGT
ncbi:MAG: TnsD family Tn7-like transposition protein [Methylovirgula sp.]